MQADAPSRESCHQRSPCWAASCLATAIINLSSEGLDLLLALVFNALLSCCVLWAGKRTCLNCESSPLHITLPSWELRTMQDCAFHNGT